MAKKNNVAQKVALSVVSLVIGIIGGGFANIALNKIDSYEIPSKIPAHNPDTSIVGDFTVEEIKDHEFSIHFMELGNKYTGDSTLVKAGTKEVLIDAGSKVTSVETIYNYASQYVEGALDYIIVTHAHEDHYAGFATSKYDDSIFSKFNVGSGTTIIDFAQITTNKASNKMYQNYAKNLAQAVSNGAKHFTCQEMIDNGDSIVTLSSNVTMEILKTKYYKEVSSTENNHSVCTMFSNGPHNYLLTGDLEKEGEESLVNMNTLKTVDVYKAGHHGSKTSSSKKLMEVIQPKEVCVCCCAGSSEYTSNNLNQFPTQEFINNVAPYTINIFVTTQCVDYGKGTFKPMNGNIIVTSNTGASNVTNYFTTDDTILKETEWFKANRTWPTI